VIFTTIQKFLPEEKGDRFPLLSDRRNIVVIADEAHRSQYDFIDGFARHMRDALPNASFIGFTATPIEKSDRNTRAVFGHDIDVYDIHQAIEDGATVPIYYEARLAKLDLKEEEKPKIDPEFEEVTEGEEESVKEQLKTKWARLEALVGAEKRVQLRPQWHDTADESGFIKVVMTWSAADPVEWQQHIRDKARRQRLGDRFTGILRCPGDKPQCGKGSG